MKSSISPLSAFVTDYMAYLFCFFQNACCGYKGFVDYLKNISDVPDESCFTSETSSTSDATITTFTAHKVLFNVISNNN